MKCMRRTAGYTWTDYKTNAQIAKELKITSILDKLLEYKRNWIQHVNRMPRHRLPRVLRRWDVGIWIGFGWPRIDRWRTLVSAVMNLRVQLNAGNFLTSCKPVSFSRTLHHGISKCGNRRVGGHWGDLGVDGWIILGWTSRRWDVSIWTGVGWPRIETDGGRL